MQRLARFLMCGFFIVAVGCAAKAPWEKVDYDRQAEAYTNLGFGYLEQGQTGRALRDFRKALDVRSSYMKALHGTALALEQQGELALAESYFEQALQAKSSQAGHQKASQTAIRNNYAAFLFNQSRYDEARKQLELASKDVYYTDRVFVFANLGYVSIKLEQAAEAIAYFQQALALNPSFLLPHQALLGLLSQQQEWQQAERHWFVLRDAQTNDEATLKQALIVVQNTGNQKEVKYINGLLNQ